MIDFSQKICGILVPAFALRGKNDLGIGDTNSMCEAISFCARNNIAVLQILPINETGEDNSPYNAISSIALDPVLLSMIPDMVPGLNDEILSRYINSDLKNSINQGAINYSLVKELKLNILKAAFKKIALNKNITSQIDQFAREEADWLDAYTLFRTIMDRQKSKACWTLWEKHLQFFAGANKWYAETAEHEVLEQERKFWTYVQWVAYKQWLYVRQLAQENNVQLMGDIPFGISRYSADVWAERDLFDLSWSGGAPPETFFQSDLFTAKWGQNWGLPLYNWQKHENDNFAWWRRRVKKISQIFHYFRIDHVLGFYRIYAFPWNPEDNEKFVDLTHEQAKQLTGGRLPQFIPYSDDNKEHALLNKEQGEKFLKVVLQAAGNTGVVAEDLGMIPYYVRPSLAGLGIPGFSIPIFERNEDDRSFKSKNMLPAISLATYGTHDHMPLFAFYEDLVSRWHGSNGHEAWLDVQRLMKFLGGDENSPYKEFSYELYKAFMQTLMETPCWLSILMITDLLATQQRFNLPGTSQSGNWSERLEMPLTDYESMEPFKSRIALVRDLIKQTNRLPKLASLIKSE
jgi:4-alpha-glucanotransferase